MKYRNEQQRLAALLAEEGVVVGCCVLNNLSDCLEIVDFVQKNDPETTAVHRQNADLVQYNSEQVIKRREAHALLQELLDHPNVNIPFQMKRRIREVIANKHVHAE